jgi:hypothetical protein
MPSGDEIREPFRLAEDDDSDDLGGFGRGKRSYEDEEDEENGGWAINEDHSDRLWDSADEVDDDDEEEGHTAETEEVEEDDEEEADLFGGGAPRGRRGRPKGSTNANRDKAAMNTATARDPGSAFGATGGSLFDEPEPGAAADTPAGRAGSDGARRTGGDSSAGARTTSATKLAASDSAARKSEATSGRGGMSGPSKSSAKSA